MALKEIAQNLQRVSRHVSVPLRGNGFERIEQFLERTGLCKKVSVPLRGNGFEREIAGIV